MEFRDFIVANDVRREDSGKFIIIGVFFDGAHFAAFPCPEFFTVFGKYRHTQSGQFPIELRAMMADLELTRFTGILDVRNHEWSPFTGRYGFLHIPHPGELDFQIRLVEKEWVSVLKMQIVGPPPTPALVKDNGGDSRAPETA